MPEPRLLAFAGSLREASYNRKAVALLADAARAAGAQVTLVDLRDLPMPIYDGDFEAAHGLPEAARKFKQLLIEHHGVLISTPEYNSQYPALLKNAIDWASRREGDEMPMRAFSGKIAAVMSASPGALAGLRGQALLRAQLAYLGMVVVPDRVGIARAREAFDEQGALTDPAQQNAVQQLGAATVRFVQRLLM